MENKQHNPWDMSTSALVRLNPQAFVDMLVPGACYVEQKPEKLDSLEREVDALVEISIDGQLMLANFEFQAWYDAAMPDRLLRYNVLARTQYKLPVHSVVIHLLDDTRIKPSPLIWKTPNHWPGQNIPGQ